MEICTRKHDTVGDPLARKRTCSIDDKRLTRRQRRSSIFLQLPPEIRNLIYNRALGGQSLHVYAGNNQLWSAILTDPAGIKNRGRKAHLYNCVVHEHDKKREWLDEHLSCFVSAAVGLPNIQFLRTCKRIYEEASLIPYASNTFVFIAPASFEAFVSKVLSPEQSHALRSIAIWAPIAPWNVIDKEVSWKHWSIPPCIQSSDLLAGLQRLILNFSIYDEASLEHVDEIGGILAFSRTTGTGLRKVEITMTCDEGARRSGEADIDAGSIVRYVKNITDLMLERKSIEAIMMEA